MTITSKRGSTTVLKLSCAVVLLAAFSLAGCKDKKTSGCTPGTAGCVCGEDDACDDGNTCVEGICVGESVSGVTVNDENARSCEVLISEEKTKVLGAVFSDNVEGTTARQAPKTALTFVGKADTKFEKGDVALRTIEASDGTLEVSKVNCFDKQGVKLEGVEVKID